MRAPYRPTSDVWALCHLRFSPPARGAFRPPLFNSGDGRSRRAQIRCQNGRSAYPSRDTASTRIPQQPRTLENRHSYHTLTLHTRVYQKNNGFVATRMQAGDTSTDGSDTTPRKHSSTPPAARRRFSTYPHTPHHPHSTAAEWHRKSR
jgi:hypothetical protein